jgi:transposase
MHWTGYKVHITETCDRDKPHVITNVETTIAPQSDVEMTEPIHASLCKKGQLPGEHIVDGGYVDSELLVASQMDYEVELVGPIKSDSSWQSRDKHAYSIDTFDIDWEAKAVTCPQGQTTNYWKPAKDADGNDIIIIRFSRPGCRDCAGRSRCTRTKKESRTLTLRPQAQHEAIQKSRQEQKTPQWKERYNTRAGIEGTISQGVRGFGVRQARYIGLAKTHLQNTLTAAAINIARIDDWLTGTPLAKTRTSRFKAMEAWAA